MNTRTIVPQTTHPDITAEGTQDDPPTADETAAQSKTSPPDPTTVEDALNECEEAIRTYAKSGPEAGRAFKEIRESRLYRNSHGTFEEYCQATWSLTRQHVNRLIAYHEVVQDLKPHFPEDDLPKAESHARPLTSCTPKVRVQIWTNVLAAKQKGITAKLVRDAVDAFCQPGAAPRPDGYDEVFDGTSGLRLVLPGGILSEEQRESAVNDFGNFVCKADLLDEVPDYDELVEAHGGIKRPFRPESALSGIITREWPIVVPALYEDAGPHFRDNGLWSDGFMPVYRTDQLRTPATAPRPDRAEGPEGYHVLVAPGVDLLDPRMPAHVVEDILLAIEEASDERWQYFFITAFPERAKQRFPQNCWVGVVARKAAEAKAAAKALARVQCSSRFLFAAPKTDIFTDVVLQGFDWIVTGVLSEKERPLNVSEEELGALKRRASANSCELYLRKIETEHRGLPTLASTEPASTAPASTEPAPSRPPLPRKQPRLLLPPKATSK